MGASHPGLPVYEFPGWPGTPSAGVGAARAGGSFQDRVRPL